MVRSVSLKRLTLRITHITRHCCCADVDLSRFMNYTFEKITSDYLLAFFIRFHTRCYRNCSDDSLLFSNLEHFPSNELFTLLLMSSYVTFSVIKYEILCSIVNVT